MKWNREIYSCAQVMELIQEVGFLPLLDSGIRGYSAEEMVADDCRYVVLPDGGWDWPLWKWKGPIITEGNCVYGKFFAGKAGFISREWWPDFCNYRRHLHPAPSEGSIEETVLQGRSYGIPTMQGGVETIKPYVDEFIDFARSRQDLTFLVTRIGCGIAGFTDEEIAPLFEKAHEVANIVLPPGW